MRVMWKDNRETEIKLEVAEQRAIRKVARILTQLAKHHADGGVESVACTALTKVAEKWAPEPKETTDAKK